jgi:hypothetical protein
MYQIKGWAARLSTGLAIAARGAKVKRLVMATETSMMIVEVSVIAFKADNECECWLSKRVVQLERKLETPRRENWWEVGGSNL